MRRVLYVFDESNGRDFINRRLALSRIIIPGLSFLLTKKEAFHNLLKFIIVWTLKTKSFPPSLYKREEFTLFGKEGSGEIFTTICLFNYGLLSKSSST
jgi:hypothetical protein